MMEQMKNDADNNVKHKLTFEQDKTPVTFILIGVAIGVLSTLLIAGAVKCWKPRSKSSYRQPDEASEKVVVQDDD